MTTRRSPLALLVPLALAVYPLLVFLGVERLGGRGLGLVALGVFGLLALVPVALDRSRLGAALRLAPLFLLWAAAAWSDEERLVMLAPALGSLAFASVFAVSLRGDESLVERFARAARRMDTLPPAAVRHCRRVTVLWTVFLAANGLANGALALFAPVGWWALWAGGLSYVLLALVAGAEYAYRLRVVVPVADREARELGLVPGDGRDAA